MTREELKIILGIIVAAYPSQFAVNQTMFNLWYDLIGKQDFEITLHSVRQYIRDNKYPPSIADVTARYDVAIAEKRRLRYALRDLYVTALSYYPGAEETEENVKAWASVVMGLPADQREDRANELVHEVIRYVRSYDNDGKPLPKFTECMRSIK